MGELFPHKEPGDDLEADHVNRLSDVARKVSDGTETGYTINEGGKSAGLMPFIQRPMVVTGRGCDFDGDGSVSAAEQRLFEVRPRYYDPFDDTWRTDLDAGPYCLDPEAVDISVEVDDVVVAYYDPQSGRFIPTEGGGKAKGYRVLFEIDETLSDIDAFRAAKCTVLWKVCGGGDIPDVLGSNQIIVLDPLECVFDEDGADLIDRKGIAEWMEPLDVSILESSSSSPSGSTSSSGSSASSSASVSASSLFSSASSSGGNNCRWVVTSLCCPETAANDSSSSSSVSSSSSG